MCDFVKEVLGDAVDYSVAIPPRMLGPRHATKGLWKIRVSLDNGDISFDQLALLSDAFGTRKIDFELHHSTSDFSEVTPSDPSSMYLVISDIDPTNVALPDHQLNEE